MATISKEQRYQDMKDHNGMYSLYNYMYHYLLDNFEPENLESSFACENAEHLLVKEGKGYNAAGNITMSDSDITQTARKAIRNFCTNNGEKGDPGNNMGKNHSSTFDNIKSALEDHRW